MTVFEYAYKRFEETFEVKLNQNAEKHFNNMTLEFGGDEVITAVDIVCDQYFDVETAFHKLRGVLFNRRKFANMIKEEKQQITLILPKRIISEIEQYALMSEMSLSGLISEILDDYLEESSLRE